MLLNRHSQLFNFRIEIMVCIRYLKGKQVAACGLKSVDKPSDTLQNMNHVQCVEYYGL